MTAETSSLKPWSGLSADERVALQSAYQRELDSLPPTCSMETKVERFASWLKGQGVSFSMDDLRR